MTAGAFSSPSPITTRSDGEAFVVALMDIMDSLLGVLEQETEMVRAGRIEAATQLEQPKVDLARHYVAAIARLKASHAFLKETMPDVLETLQRRHDTFRSLLQINLTVLATAHAVSEGIVRGVSQELARKAAPSTYGASGLANAPNPRIAQPLAVSRVL